MKYLFLLFLCKVNSCGIKILFNSIKSDLIKMHQLQVSLSFNMRFFQMHSDSESVSGSAFIHVGSFEKLVSYIKVQSAQIYEYGQLINSKTIDPVVLDQMRIINDSFNSDNPVIKRFVEKNSYKVKPVYFVDDFYLENPYLTLHYGIMRYEPLIRHLSSSLLYDEKPLYLPHYQVYSNQFDVVPCITFRKFDNERIITLNLLPIDDEILQKSLDCNGCRYCLCDFLKAHCSPKTESCIECEYAKYFNDLYKANSFEELEPIHSKIFSSVKTDLISSVFFR
jgi:hypothetical protein